MGVSIKSASDTLHSQSVGRMKWTYARRGV
jgi:hypothetical protein